MEVKKFVLQIINTKRDKLPPELKTREWDVTKTTLSNLVNIKSDGYDAVYYNGISLDNIGETLYQIRRVLLVGGFVCLVTNISAELLYQILSNTGFVQIQVERKNDKFIVQASKQPMDISSWGYKARVAISTLIPFVDGPCGKRLAPVTTEWHRIRMRLVPPFGFNWEDLFIDGYEVGVGRNLAAQMALDRDMDYLFFLDYDVIPPRHILQQLTMKIQHHPELEMISGVYCVKSDYPAPLVYKGYCNGPFWLWKVGDFLNEGITCASIGCMIIRTSLFKKLSYSEEKPWFKTLNIMDESFNNCVFQVTEDCWFFRRVVEEIGPNKIGIDTSLLCTHIDNNTGIKYDLPRDSYPYK